ncbi:MAG: 2Fe-2S iron-sulfur cluster-binding protein, partial [SAR324 cluster bacterium]|nr:2Fe-2S iron-sulfur cluster-binding protein [SAR324 cluster bacterium]
MSSASVVFTPSGKRGNFPHGTPVLQAARSLGVDLDSVCGGRGICARCQVIHTTGEFPKHGLVSAASHLSPFDATEEKLVRKSTRLKSGRRLGCTAQILGDCVIDVPPESQIHRQVVRKEA